MREDFIEFTPSHLPFLITNHLPKVPADDPARGPGSWSSPSTSPSSAGKTGTRRTASARSFRPCWPGPWPAGTTTEGAAASTRPPRSTPRRRPTGSATTPSPISSPAAACSTPTYTSPPTTCGASGRPGATRTPSRRAPTGYSKPPWSHAGSPSPARTAGGYDSRASAWPASRTDASTPIAVDEAVQQVQQHYIPLYDSLLRVMSECCTYCTAVLWVLQYSKTNPMVYLPAGRPDMTLSLPVASAGIGAAALTGLTGPQWCSSLLRPATEGILPHSIGTLGSVRLRTTGVVGNGATPIHPGAGPQARLVPSIALRFHQERNWSS